MWGVIEGMCVWTVAPGWVGERGLREVWDWAPLPGWKGRCCVRGEGNGWGVSRGWSIGVEGWLSVEPEVVRLNEVDWGC